MITVQQCLSFIQLKTNMILANRFSNNSKIEKIQKLMGNQNIGNSSINQSWYEQGSVDFRIPGIPKLVFNPTLQLFADKYNVEFPDRNTFLSQCQLFKKRSGMLSNSLVQIIVVQEIDTTKSNKKSIQIKTQILTQRINWRMFLQPLASLTLLEGWYLLLGILNGIQQLCEFYKRPFLINQKIVGINSEGIVKIWCNKNFSSNKCEEEIQRFNIKNILLEIVNLINNYIERGYFQPFKQRFLQMDTVSFYQFKFQLGQFLKSQQLVLSPQIGKKIVQKNYKKNYSQKNTIFYPSLSPKENSIKKIKFNKSPQRYYHKRSETCQIPEAFCQVKQVQQNSQRHKTNRTQQYFNNVKDKSPQQVTFRPYFVSPKSSNGNINSLGKNKHYSPIFKNNLAQAQQNSARFIFSKQKHKSQDFQGTDDIAMKKLQNEEKHSSFINLFKKQTTLSRYPDSKQELPLKQHYKKENLQLADQNYEQKVQSQFKHSRKYKSGDILYSKTSPYQASSYKKISQNNSPIKPVKQDIFVANIHKNTTIGKFIKQKLKTENNQIQQWNPFLNKYKQNYENDLDISERNLDPLELQTHQIRLLEQIRKSNSLFNNCHDINDRLSQFGQRLPVDKKYLQEKSMYTFSVNKQKKQSGKMLFIHNTQPSFQCPKRRKKLILYDISQEKQNIPSQGLVQIPSQLPEISQIKGHKIFFKGQKDECTTNRQILRTNRQSY